MAINYFKKMISSDRVVNKVQDNITLWTNQFISQPFVNGKMLEKIDSVSGEFTILHNLGKPISGSIVVNCHSTFTNAPFLRIISSDNSSAKVEGNFTGKIDIYIF